MISKIEAEEIISSQLDEDRLRRIIRNTSVVAWQKKISDVQIEKWLNNFKGLYFDNVENERKLALWLLAHFTYFTYDDIRILCKDLFNQYLHEKLCNYKGKDLRQYTNNIIQNTLFVGLGNDSESGNNILYYFRQENGLSKKNFEINTMQIYDNLVYVDDVTISGRQAIQYIKSRNINAKNTYAALLIATEDAVEKLGKSDIGVKPIATIILDQRDKAFSELSYAFSEKRIVQIRDIAHDFCKLYGKIAMEGYGYMLNHPVGFGDGQLMISFEYNTPNNTLPIFWGTGNGWIPLFKRYEKVYYEEEYLLDGRKYY